MSLDSGIAAELNTAIDTIIIEAKQEENMPDVQPMEAEVADAGGDGDGSRENGEDGSEGEIQDTKAVADSRSENTETGSEAQQTNELSYPSDFALTKAIQAGLSLEDAKYFPNDKSLLRVVASIESAKQVGQKTEIDQEEDPFANLPILDPEVYEPEVIKIFDSLVGVVKKQQETIKGLQSYQEYSVHTNQAATARDVEDWFNGQVKKLGEDFHDALGIGDYGTLPKGSSQFAKRDNIANQMAVLLAGYNAAGQRPPTREEIFDTAVNIVLKDDLRAIYEKKLSKDLAKRSNQHVSRPGSKKNFPVTGENTLDEVAAMVNERFFQNKIK